MGRYLEQLFAGKRIESLQREVAELRKELDEARLAVATLSEASERSRLREQARIDAATYDAFFPLFRDLTPILARLLADSRGHDHLEQPVDQLLETLQFHGLETTGTLGAEVPFDPNLHDAPRDAGLTAGESVVVRARGLGFKGARLRKIGVSRQG
ncbi:hypothetical protein Pan216_26730 [Planctomycetes bacterium Pan216]|uniref:Protein GrpE n=1 Tax=Kolteria novifilia TaxID=2527975 RepID=A0A518B4A0_9BACT|nr:hypothetical protein Pan216_26730 [Planctomycetes bacterium Pan216]